MSFYDHPEIYDLLFDGDSRAQQEFLVGCFQRHARRYVDRVFEPGCGTGRLLVRLAALGYEVAGLDANPRALAFARDRFRRSGLAGAIEPGDMASFELARPVDAAFCLINTFRHLPTDEAAAGHLRSIARALSPGGIYVLGLHLLPEAAPTCVEEVESIRRGDRNVRSRIRTIALDRARREERIGVEVDVTGPAGASRIEDEFTFRTYSWSELLELVGRAGDLEPVAVHGFEYDVDREVAVDARSEAVVVVLRRR